MHCVLISIRSILLSYWIPVYPSSKFQQPLWQMPRSNLWAIAFANGVAPNRSKKSHRFSSKICARKGGRSSLTFCRLQTKKPLHKQGAWIATKLTTNLINLLPAISGSTVFSKCHSHLNKPFLQTGTSWSPHHTGST